MNKTLRHFGLDIIITVVGLIVAFIYAGPNGLTLAAILAALEIVFSFDNAAVNARYLSRMNAFWRKMFLTVGILIAVFGMRLVFPFVIVCLAGDVGPGEAWRLAMKQGDVHTPGTYGFILEQAHASIASFGGTFLLLLFLGFLFDAERDSTWLSWIERPLIKAGHFDSLPVGVALMALLGASALVPSEERSQVLLAGVLGILTFVMVNGLATFMESRQEAKEVALESQEASAGQALLLSGKAAFSLFMFLEVLDASFSFDGVLGAFAVTPDPILIAIGLGIGAMAVRSMTIYLVDNGTLAEYAYLEHGAHWAIGTLATMLLLTLRFDIPDAVIGLCGIVFITAAWWTSKQENKRSAHDDDHSEPAPGIYSSHPDHGHSTTTANA